MSISDAEQLTHVYGSSKYQRKLKSRSLYPNGETYIWGFFFFASEIYHYINSMF